ncbi:MAG: hypothetical protein CMI96_01095 [Pelagibacteraceae bacterium]|nr:hypothetical protein [Pelagibacteraceae bacterium]
MHHKIKYPLVGFIFFITLYGKTDIKIISSTEKRLLIELDISVTTAADLFPKSIFVGLPNGIMPKAEIILSEESQIPFRSDNTNLNILEWANIQILKNLNTATLKVFPKTSANSYLNKIRISIIFSKGENSYRPADKNESKILSNKIINWNQAKNWVLKEDRKSKRTEALPAGIWLNFLVYKDDLYSISYELLKNNIDNIDDYDPRSVMLFMTPELGRSKSQETNLSLSENMIEVPIIFEGETDGLFEENDRIIFYGRSQSGFDVNGDNVDWNQNLYFNHNKCWILFPDDSSIRGKRIAQSNAPDEVFLTLDYGISYNHYENDIVNLELSGLNWYGSPITFGSSQPISTNTPNAKENVDGTIELKIKGHSTSGSLNTFHNIEVYLNEPSSNKIGNTASWSGNGTRTISASLLGQDLNRLENTFFINNTSSDNNSSPYLDYLTIKYGRELIFNSDGIEFFSPIKNTNVRFNFHSNLPSNVLALDITYPNQPKTIEIIDNQKLEVVLEGENTGRFIVVDRSEILNIDEINYEPGINFNSLRNENLAANYIIIGPEVFYEAAKPILDLRSPSIYASLENIYKEFSAGNEDPMAIRSFLQWTQEHWMNPKPIHLLLLGDSGYDYRNINGESSIIVPTVQVQSYISYPSDDRLSTIYGTMPEFSTGRFPAKNSNEVENFAEKILFIESNPNYGSWKQKITLVADDAARPEPNHGGIATGKSHTLNSETIASIIPSKIDIEKIYMLEYPEVSDASAYGVVKPDATEAVFQSLKNGTSIINYIGHGSASQLAQEKLLYLNRGDIDNIKTNFKMPLWIVGTCSFGHFDDPLAESFGEQLIRYPMDGAAAVISTCRPITVTGNERYTQEIFERIFNDNQVTQQNLGVILQSIKNGSSESEYFHLFGDPAMRLSIPHNYFETISVDKDTLSTLEIASVDFYQNLIVNNGSGIILLKDANRDVTRTYNIASTEQSITYTLPGPTLFRGNFTFSNSQSSVQIRIPQDISYSSSPGKILVYLYDNETDALSEINNIFLIGGENSIDNLGPIIEFKTSTGRILRNGDHKGINENLILSISDPLGINLTKELGHSIILENLSTGESLDITDQFYYNINSITTGEIMLDNLGESDINVKIYAWDNANNPSQNEIYLYISKNDKLKIYNVFNFPNPIIDNTKFTFELSLSAEVEIFIYTIGGRKIKHIRSRSFTQGFNSILWDGKNEFGRVLSNGVYVYKIIAKNNNKKISHIGRCAVLK